MSGAVIEIRSGSAHEEGGHGLPALLREQPRSRQHARSVTHFLKCNTQTRIQCQPAIKGGGRGMRMPVTGPLQFYFMDGFDRKCL